MQLTMARSALQDTYIDIFFMYFIKMDEVGHLKQEYDVNWGPIVRTLPSQHLP